jgi:hypothetical protein
MLFLIPHLFPTARLLEVAAQDLRLPALQTLLARGSRQPCAAEGVETAVCETLGIARQQDWPLAPMTLVADGGVAGTAYWLRADPVHLRVMRDRIVLADSSAFDLTQPEADALAATIGQHFGADLSPIPLHPRRWYLRLDRIPRLTTTALSVAAGRDIDPLQPQGEDAMQFRARMNELQMLLHDHPVNLAREARGDLPVNSLWLWGGGTQPAVPAKRTILYARDATAHALGAFCNAQVHPLPNHLEEPMFDAESLILLDDLAHAGQCGDPYGWREALRTLEVNWFAPLLATLHTRGRSDLRLADPISGKALHLRRADAWKLWRRPRSLISMLG